MNFEGAGIVESTEIPSNTGKPVGIAGVSTQGLTTIQATTQHHNC
jgi:hypothetical protein